MDASMKDWPKSRRPLLADIFPEMAVLALVEFVLIALVVSSVLEGQRRESGRAQAGQLARAVAAGLAQSGLDPAAIDRTAAELRRAFAAARADLSPALLFYAPGRGVRMLQGPASLEGELESFEENLQAAFLTREPLSEFEMRDEGGRPRLWVGAPIGMDSMRPARGSVLVGLVHPSRWEWLQGQWSLAAYILVLLGTLLGLGAYRVRTLVVEPLGQLALAAAAVTLGKRDIELPDSRNLEIARLSGQFEEMTRQLSEREGALRERLGQLERTQEELVQSEKMAMVGRLAAGIAHEVGNPLSAVAGFLDILQSPDLASGQREDLLRRGSQELGRADRILRDLLDFAKPRPFAPENLALAGTVRKVLEMARARQMFHNVEIVEEMDSSVRAWADPGFVEQILVNLLMNAADALSSGGRIRIEVRAGPATEKPAPFPLDAGGGAPERRLAAGDPACVVRVADSGPGVDSKDAPHIFEPFFTKKTRGKGTGLGLAVSSQLAARQGGALRLADGGGRAEGGGAVFELWLPAAGEG